jgi:hypothetical protein
MPVLREAVLPRLPPLRLPALQPGSVAGWSHRVLPAGTELNGDTLERPREVFHSESLDGCKSYLMCSDQVL